MKNWIKELNEERPSALEQKLKFIDEFKKRVYKKYKLKDIGTKTERSERWGYSQKTYGILYDGFSNKEYWVDLDNSEIEVR